MNLVQLTIFKVGPRKKLTLEASLTTTEDIAIEILCEKEETCGETIPAEEVQQALNKKIGSVTKIQVQNTLFILIPLF